MSPRSSHDSYRVPAPRDQPARSSHGPAPSGPGTVQLSDCVTGGKAKKGHRLLVFLCEVMCLLWLCNWLFVSPFPVARVCLWSPFKPLPLGAFMSGRLCSEQAHPSAACCELRSCVDSALSSPSPPLRPPPHFVQTSGTHPPATADLPASRSLS